MMEDRITASGTSLNDNGIYVVDAVITPCQADTGKAHSVETGKFLD